MSSKARARLVALVFATLLSLSPARRARSQSAWQPAFRDVPLFSISKSENRNQVELAVRLDAQCAPVDEAPVFGYWRMLEKGAATFEPILAREQPAYGIASQKIVAQSEGESVVRVTLRALPSRAIVVRAFRTADGCAARAEMPIAGSAAQLANVHAVLRWPFGIDRLLVSGWALADRRQVQEALRP